MLPLKTKSLSLYRMKNVSECIKRNRTLLFPSEEPFGPEYCNSKHLKPEVGDSKKILI